jgi:hypothetical protein
VHQVAVVVLYTVIPTAYMCNKYRIHHTYSAVERFTVPQKDRERLSSTIHNKTTRIFTEKVNYTENH